MYLRTYCIQSLVATLHHISGSPLGKIMSFSLYSTSHIEAFQEGSLKIKYHTWKKLLNKLWGFRSCSPRRLAENMLSCNWTVEPNCGRRWSRDVTHRKWDCVSRKPFIHRLRNTLHRLSLNLGTWKALWKQGNPSRDLKLPRYEWGRRSGRGHGLRAQLAST